MAFEIGKNCRIDPRAEINVRHGFLGDGAQIRAGAKIIGDHVEIGREAFLDEGASIGGGSCMDPGAKIVVGDWLHMGLNSHINIARGVTIGHEFGCGIETKVFSHGAYIDAINLGAPVQWESVEIGDSVWLPNAWVNPGVRIGSNVVVAAKSLVNRDIPAGALAGGVPATVLKENCFPRPLTPEEKKLRLTTVIAQAWNRYRGEFKRAEEVCPWVSLDDGTMTVDEGNGQTCSFNVHAKTIEGACTAWTLLLKDQLRRNGVRFRYTQAGERWRAWSADPRVI